MKKVYGALQGNHYEDAQSRIIELQRTSMRTWYVQHFSEELRTLRRLYKETKSQQVLAIAEQLGKIAVAAFPKDSFIASQYGWVLYDYYMKGHVTAEQKEQAAAWILTHTIQGTYSPYEATIWRLLPLYEQKSMQYAYELLQRLNPRLLSRDELRTVRHGETIIHPSSREKYYRKWIDYTWQLNDARACYKACYELMYTSGVTVRQVLPVYVKMIQALKAQGRQQEATTFAKALATEHGYASLLREME